MKPQRLLREWTINDIQELFNNQVAEDSTLDYKQEINQSIAKTISAMANTNGGIVICGIDANSTNNVPIKICPIVGQKPIDSIGQLCNDNISPPINLRTHTIPVPDTNGNVLLIEVPESEIAPHIFLPKDRVYIRLNSESKPADFQQLQWLNNNRQKAIEFRKTLIEQVSKKIDGLASGRIDYYSLNIAITPTYPTKIIVDFYDLQQKLVDVLPESLKRMYYNHPNGWFHNFNEGTIFRRTYADSPLEHCFCVTSYGTFHSATFEALTKQEGGNLIYLNLQILARRLLECLGLGREYLRYIDLYGALSIKVQLTNIMNTQLWGRPYEHFWGNKCELVNEVSGKYELKALEFFDNNLTFPKDFMKRVLHCYGISGGASGSADTIVEEMKMMIERTGWSL